MDLTSRILVTGATGLAGSAIVRTLIANGFTNITATYNRRRVSDTFDPGTGEKEQRRFLRIDLLDAAAVKELFINERPEYVFIAAARVGGIMANHTYRAEFIYENLQIQNNLIHNSYLYAVKKLIFLGSTCIYPTRAPQPMQESCLLTDALEYLSEPYAVAKIAEVKMCESYNLQYGCNFIAVMPTNLYGKNDNYDLEHSHFLPAFIRKMHLGKALASGNWKALEDDLARNPVRGHPLPQSRGELVRLLEAFGISGKGAATSVTPWGTGKPRREVLYADDLASACIHIMKQVSFADLCKEAGSVYSGGNVKEEVRNTQVNIGLGYDYTLQEIALKVKQVIGFEGNIIWDTQMPDGTFQKLTDVGRLERLGWKEHTPLEEGIRKTYRSYLAPVLALVR